MLLENKSNLKEEEEDHITTDSALPTPTKSETGII